MNLHGKSILVTGGAGFIGSELSRQLLAAGAKVVIVDNLANGKRENVAEILGDACVLRVTDIRDYPAMQALVREADIVFHLACLGVRHSIHSPLENHAVNAEATLRLLMMAQEKGLERFVYVSSSEVYGTAMQVPQPETHPTFPMTVYGAAKLAGEAYTRAYHRTYGLPTVVIRPFNTYGPRCHHEGDSGEVIPLQAPARALEQEPTHREVEVLQLISDGLVNREIGERLGLTEGTVKWYMQQIYDKLGVRRRPQAVLRARQFGILT